MNEELIKFLIARVIDNAQDAIEESGNDRSDPFLQGKRLAYYEILDSLKNELTANGVDLKEFGLDVDLDNTFA